MVGNIGVDQIKKRGGKLSDILGEQQELFQQFQSIHMQKIGEFGELCDRHVKNLGAIKCCRREAIIGEARKLVDYVEKRVAEETVHVNTQEAQDGVQSSLLSLLFS
uniref:XLR/SYCP3/FAM9 domain-containing protein n=1 Tax=Mus musculus TaxID=10090 RepID=Q8C1K9_MOUSE|nr:unnamed protein product [Mus musculus]